MKVVYIYEGLPAYRKDFFVLLNDRLKKEGHDLLILYGRKNANESLQLSENLGFDAKSFPVKTYIKKGPLKFIGFLGLVRYFKSKSPDVYVLQFHVSTLTYWRLYIYSKLNNIPYITWDCNYLKPELGRRARSLRKYLTDKVYKNAKVCVTYGTKFKNELLQICKNEKDIIVAQNTINIEKIYSNRSELCNNKHFDHPLHILYVGVVNDRKNVEAAIIAVAELIKEGHNIYFDIVGGGDSYDNCATLAKNLDVTDRVVLHGPKYSTELQYYFENADVFVLPGTGGLAINEAMAYSLPIISTEGDGTILDLIDGNGYLLKNNGDVSELKNAILNFIRLPEEEKKKMSKKSEDIILKKASLENMVNQHIIAIKRVLE